MHHSSSPAPFSEAQFILSLHSSPVTPTPKHTHGEELMWSPISAYKFKSKQPQCDDSVFQEYKTLLKNAMTLVTFKWDAENSKGTLVPVP